MGMNVIFFENNKGAVDFVLDTASLGSYYKQSAPFLLQ